MAVFNPAHAKERYVLFVRPRDREMEIWNGRRAGVEGAVATYGADAAYPSMSSTRSCASTRSTGRRSSTGWEPAFDARITRLLGELRGVRARGPATPIRVEDPGPILHEMRLRRSPAELARQRRACEISRDAHIEAMRYARPGMYEYQVQAAHGVRVPRGRLAAQRLPSIVASGANATASSTTARTAGAWRTATCC